jgi:hypothetical protein
VLVKTFFAATAGLTAALSFGLAIAAPGSRTTTDVDVLSPANIAVPTLRHTPAPTRAIALDALSQVVHTYCGGCHNPTEMRGNISLETYDVAKARDSLVLSEKMIRKLRAEMMPPPKAKRPGGDTLKVLVETLESVIDKGARPNPGSRVFQRLNRPEYERAIRDLLELEINAGDFLPLDTKSANFDNIADAQALSPLLLEAYLNAASAVSRMAVGDRNATSTLSSYKTSPFLSQHPWDRVEGAPFGTRGGLVGPHVFPADGLYEFKINVGGGSGSRLEDLDISVDGKRVALVRFERGVGRYGTVQSADLPQGFDFLKTEAIQIAAGQHKVSVTFVRRTDGPYEDLIKPHEWSNASAGTGSAGATEPANVVEVHITGPSKVTGLSDSPSRQRVFTCNPSAATQQRSCAESIINRIGSRAYRRPLTEGDRTKLLAFYDRGAATGGFEEGVRMALQAILASPYFVFRFESAPTTVAAGQDYRISDLELASRLSFFLWGTLPDSQLLTLGEQKKLSDKKILEREVRRMLADPRSEALSTRFAAQWLRLQDIEKVHPDAFLFPDFNLQLAHSMQRETELFFNDIVQNDRSVLDLFTADYTFVNERLARHYGIPNVAGPEFRKVQYPDVMRRGVLGHGSMLVQTSLGNRTSPVLRGKWVMEVLIGMPPPPPPPDVPDLEQTKEAENGKPLTTRQRTEIHRQNPVCNACHQYMDPMGLALDNFDVTAKWRYRENSIELDTRGQLYDGTQIKTPADLTQALIKRPIPLVRSFTENLMAYAIGRRVEDHDQPAIRVISREAEAKGYRLSSFVLGVVNSGAFQYKRVEAAVADMHEADR